MGWSSWNTFRNRIDENLIYDTAVAMKEKGLVDAGYHFVNIDDNWVDNARDDEGRIQADKLTFPNGIPALVEKVNAMGISLGVYSSNGTATCEDLTASLYHEWTDAYTFAKWGVEYFKYDFCHNIPLSEYAPLVYAVTISKNGIGRTYDCKEAELSGLARYMKKKGFDGKYVSGLDRREGAMTFDNIEVEEDGVYNVTVHIVKHGQYEKCLMLEANGSEREVLIFPSQKRFNMTAKFTVSMRLKKGKNTLKLFNPIGTRADSAMLQYVNMGRQLKKPPKKSRGTPANPKNPSLSQFANGASISRISGDDTRAICGAQPPISARYGRGSKSFTTTPSNFISTRAWAAGTIPTCWKSATENSRSSKTARTLRCGA